MKPKSGKQRFNAEIIGAVMAVLLIVCGVMVLLHPEDAAIFLLLITQLGILVNGIIAWLNFQKGNKMIGRIILVCTLALLIFFVLQVVTFSISSLPQINSNG